MQLAELAEKGRRRAGYLLQLISASAAENKVNAWLPGIAQSNERIALVSLAYNNLIEQDAHLLAVLRYIEQNPVRAHLNVQQLVFGSADLDTLTGGRKGDRLYGGGGADVLLDNGGRDYLEGNDGSDRLEGGAGADTMAGSQGNDTYVVDDLGDQVIEIGDNGSDTVESSVQFSLAGTTVEDLTLTGTEDLDGTGNKLDNLITGNADVNRLDGKGGTDHLIGGLGNEWIANGLLKLALTR